MVLQAKVELPQQIKEPPSPRSPGIISRLARRQYSSNGSPSKTPAVDTAGTSRNGDSVIEGASPKHAPVELNRVSSVPTCSHEHTPVNRSFSAAPATGRRASSTAR